MTQFKEKSEKQRESTTVGLFNYPALMAADILLYETDEVPVGEDQKQHIELTRDVAERFNKQYGEVFKLPNPRIIKETARIMSLQDPSKKMSKSDSNQLGTINLLDTEDQIREKIKRAVTDSGSEIKYDEKEKPAISNLLTIYSAVSGLTVEQLEGKYKGIAYSQFKEDLGNEFISFFLPIQEKYYKIRSEKDYLNKVLNDGRDLAMEKSSKKIRQVNEAMGLGRV